MVGDPFYHAYDGITRYPNVDMSTLYPYRGPFSKTSEYLASFPKAQLHLLTHERDAVLEELGGDGTKLAIT